MSSLLVSLLFFAADHDNTDSDSLSSHVSEPATECIESSGTVANQETSMFSALLMLFLHIPSIPYAEA